MKLEDLHEDRLRPHQAQSDRTQSNEHTRNTQISSRPRRQQLLLAKQPGRAHRNHYKAIHCSLPLVLLIILCTFNQSPSQHQNHHHHRPSTLAAEAQFLFTYEINQESDESRVPRSSLFDPSSFKIVTPSQLQSSYQKLASQLPEQAPQVQPTPPSVAADQSTLNGGPTEAAANQQRQQQQFQSLLEPPVPSTTAQSVSPSSASSSFLKQTSAAIQSFAELFHLTPPTVPSPLGALTNPASSPPTAQQQQTLPAINGIDQQAEARSLHEHWTQQQQRAHHQAGGQPQQQMSAFQSFTTSPSVQSSQQAGSAPTSTNHNHQHHHHHHQHQPQQQQHQQNSGSQASYWLTSNPLNAPDGNFLVEIKNSGESAGANQDGEHSLSRGHQAHQSLVSQQQAPPATTASSLARPVSAQGSFLSTPTSAYFGLPANANNVKPVAPIHQTSQVAPTPVVSQLDRFNQQSFRKQQHFQPQSQALHQHQARSLSPQKQQQQAQQARYPTTTIASASHYQSDQLEPGHGQLQPPANTPERYNGAGLASHGHNVASGHQLAPLKSAEESLLAFRQQQQNQHDQQSALMAAVQNGQFGSGQPSRPSSSSSVNIEQPASTSNSLTDDDVVTGHPHTHHNHQHHNHYQPAGPFESNGGEQRPKLPVGGLTSNAYTAPQPTPQNRHQQVPAPSEIPKVSPQIYESFLLQQKDQYEKHMELLKQQQELNKLLEQKQKQQREQQEQAQEAEKVKKRKKAELERVEARKKAQAAREQEQQMVAARKARQEAEEARRKHLRQLEEEEAKRRQLAEEERRYRELIEAREREEAKRKRQEAEEAAELARRQREQEERDALAEQQKKRRKQQEAAEEEAKQQQQYRNYLKQQEELKKLLELKQKEDEAAQARQRQAGQQLQQQQQHGVRSVSSTRASKLALEHKERSRQSNGPQQTGGGSQGTQWGGRQTRVRVGTLEPQVVAPSNGASSPDAQQQVSSTSTTPTSTTSTTSTTTAGTPSVSSASSASSAPRVGTRLSAASNSGLRRLKTDEKLIRQKIPLYSGAGKYGLYRSDSNSEELAKLLDAVTLPPTTSTTTTTTTTTTTPASSRASSSSSAPADVLDSDEQSSRRQQLTASSLSPLLNLRELAVTPPSSSLAAAQARATTDESFSSTTIFDDDVPRRPTSRTNPTGSGTPTRSVATQQRRSFPAPISPAASSTSSTRTTLTNRMGTSATLSVSNSSSSSQSSHRGASIGLASLPADSDNDGIPGRAGHEYPVLAEVPQTSFSCSRMKLSGFFADTETACQVVHLCQDGAQSSILCPNGTIFNQEKFSCQWWYEVNCARAPMFYQLNDNLYKSTLTQAGASSSSSSTDQDSSTSTSVELNKRTRTSSANSLNDKQA